jgi:hypothetical protein
MSKFGCCLITIFIFFGITSHAAADQIAVEKILLDALTCQHDSPADLIREIARTPSAGLMISNSQQEGYDEKIAIKTKHALRLYGARSHTVNLAFENTIRNFNATVYSVFKGNPQKVISALKLSKDQSEARIGDYTNHPTGTECPATIGLTIINKSTFALGCGWCNGD